MTEEVDQIREAIAALEARRAILGDDVVETTVAAMRERLAELAWDTPHAQHKQIAVLMADLSGFTAMSETRDAEEVRDTMDALWRRLDGLIVAWGGYIDQHLGDGLVALFGVPQAREDDPERAVSAALAMQAALRVFNREVQTRPALGMRVGVSMGRTLLGPAGNDGVTALGKTVEVARRLEQAAPVGAVLISHEVYRHVRGRFEVSAHPSRPSFSHPVYRVRRERPRQARGHRRGVEGVETRMIGRERELGRLQSLFHQLLLGGPGRAVTVVGEAGLGKSRLRHEFKQWLRHGAGEDAGPSSAESPFLLETGAGLQMRRLPYALLRDLISTFCQIQENDPLEVARHKLVARLQTVLGGGNRGLDEAGARRLAHFIGQLIGFDFSRSPHLHAILDDARQIRQQAFAALTQFFLALSSVDPVVIMLEDIHWADEGSLDLLLHLMNECGQCRLLLIFFSRPSLFQRRPIWRRLAQPGMIHSLVTLDPLSPADSRRLIHEILRKAPELPAGLTSQIVESAGGNPFYVEEIIKVLIEDGAIDTTGEQWQVSRRWLRRRTLPVPATLTGVLQARVDRLSPRERTVLQRAAVVGRVFWDSVVAALGDNGSLDLHHTLAALEAKELVFRRSRSLFGGSREYIFKHAVLREVTYESLLRRQRRDYHGRVAAWLAGQGGERVREYAGLIGEHFEKAGDTASAATWYGRAAVQARTSYAPETAIHYFRQALSFLPEGEDTLEQQVAWYGGLGEMLRWRARFAEAVDALEKMLRAAEAGGDLEAQARAWKGLFLAHDYQGEHRAALVSAQGAERVARAAGSQSDLAMALSAKGWSLLYLGQEARALELGEKALALSRRAGTAREIAYSYTLLGGVYRVLRRYEASSAATRRALELFRSLDDRIWEGLMLYNLGQTARLQGEYAEAIRSYEAALAIAGEIGDRYGEMSALNRLGKVARLQGAYRRAETYQREALALAEKSRNKGRVAYICHELGDLYLARALEGTPARRENHLEQATRWLRRARRQARDGGQPVTEAAATAGLARVHLALGEGAAALEQAREALAASRLQVVLWEGIAAQKVAGTSWWVLGQIAANRPEGKVEIEGEPFSAVSCFEASLDTWDEIGSGVDWERARTLRDLGAVLLAEGQEARGRQLRLEAAAIFTELGMMQELAHIGHDAPE